MTTTATTVLEQGRVRARDRYPNPARSRGSHPTPLEPAAPPSLSPTRPSTDPMTTLIIHRPRAWRSPGAGRRIRLELDDNLIGHLGHGTSVRVVTTPGPHRLRARCRPIIADEYAFAARSGHTLWLSIHVDNVEGFGHLEIRAHSTPDPRVAHRARRGATE